MFRLEHVYSLLRRDANGALDGESVASDGKCIIRAAVLQHLQAALQIAGLHEGGGGVNAANFSGRLSVLLLPIDGVGNNGDGSGMVIRQFRRPHEGHLGAVRFGHFGNFLIVGTDDDAIKAPALDGRPDGPSDHGQAAKGFNIFAWYAFAATTGGNGSKPHTPMASFKLLTT